GGSRETVVCEGQASRDRPWPPPRQPERSPSSCGLVGQQALQRIRERYPPRPRLDVEDAIEGAAIKPAVGRPFGRSGIIFRANWHDFDRAGKAGELYDCFGKLVPAGFAAAREVIEAIGALLWICRAVQRDRTAGA